MRTEGKKKRPKGGGDAGGGHRKARSGAEALLQEALFRQASAGKKKRERGKERRAILPGSDVRNYPTKQRKDGAKDPPGGAERKREQEGVRGDVRQLWGHITKE